MEQHPYFQRKPETRSRKFWRVVFGSMVGFFLSNILITILSIFIILGMVAAMLSSSATPIKSNSVLRITLSGNIEERGEDNPFENTAWESFMSTPTGLDDILHCIAKAADDPNIKGISIEIRPPVSAGFATLTEIRNALENFKNSGKFIYAYSESYSQGAYYIASVADKVFVSNMGNIDLKGLAFQLMFYKGLIDKLDLDVDIVRHGTFKSAVEPFISDRMSAENREQMMLLVNDFWNVYINDVSASRNILVDSINLMADQLLCINAKTCKQLRLVDDILYPIEYQNFLRETLGIAENAKINTTTINAYKRVATPKAQAENIAIIYAYGNIMDGRGNDKNIYSENLCREIRRAYQNDKVKAIVLRVNSGGGSAMASEMIWNEIELAKATGKPVVTSMGDYAASGGYYIACNSDYIVAQDNTLTGSIGVFGMIPSLQRMLKNKLGITLDVAKSNPHADYLSVVGRPLNELEKKKLMVQIEDVYDIFTKRVANGRNLPIEKVYKIGEGRVWSGTEAKKLGLVDQLGTIDDAIAKAAELAELTDYGMVFYPRKQDFFTRFFSANLDSETKIEQALQQQLGDLYFTYKGIKTVTEVSGVQARLPFEIVISD
ncbi:MAG: signal peptide peptidase SppA [Bacteroidetes bacterium]|nr:signal peptide peptidase SppA [Bacteroidota bacterium]MCL2302046.1 signal peptide peptidase SppA [Lentimicrobiaceae bacterium]